MKLRGLVAAVVADTDQAGRGMVRGTRSVTLEGKEESITVSGWASPKDLDQGGGISFSRLGEGKLVFRTFLSPSRDTLTAQDIQQIVSPQKQAAAPAASAPATAPSATLALTEARKKELLLVYLNRLVDVLFSK